MINELQEKNPSVPKINYTLIIASDLEPAFLFRWPTVLLDFCQCAVMSIHPWLDCRQISDFSGQKDGIPCNLSGVWASIHQYIPRMNHCRQNVGFSGRKDGLPWNLSRVWASIHHCVVITRAKLYHFVKLKLQTLNQTFGGKWVKPGEWGTNFNHNGWHFVLWNNGWSIAVRSCHIK